MPDETTGVRPPSCHILRSGIVLCGSLHGVPRGWGPGLYWIGFNDPAWRQLATCPTCHEVNERLELQKSP